MSLESRLARLRAELSPHPWTWALASAATLWAVRTRALALFDAARPLAEFRDRAIGATTMQAVDASGYAKGYMALVALTGLVFVAAAMALAFVHRRLSARGWDRELRGELWFVQLSSLFVCLTLALSVLGRWRSMLAVAGVLAGFQLLAAVLGAMRVRLARDADPRRRTLARQLARPPLLVHAAGVAVSIAVPAWSLLAFRFDLDALRGLPALLLLGALAAAVAWRDARALATRRRDGCGLPWRMARDLPLLLLPATLVLANELEHRFHRAPVVALAAILVVAVCALAPLAGRLAERWRLPSAHRLAFAVYVPAVLSGLALVVVYRHGYEVPALDTFHKGEQSLPTHQLVRFGVVPLVDLRLTHTLSDLFYPSLYTLLHGFRPGAQALDMLTWMTWMPVVVAVPLAYLLLASATSPLFALLLCAATPALTLVPPYYAMALVPALLLGRYARRPRAATLAAVWLGLVWVAAWRVDFGIAAVIALLLALAAHALPRPRLGARALLRSLVPAALVASASLLALALLSSQSLLPALARLVHSYTYRLATRVRAEIIPDYGLLAALQYYLLPAAGIATVLLFAARLMVARPVAPRRYPLLFLALFSLVISVRSLERHSLVEGFNGYLFWALAVLLPAFVLAEAPAARRRWALGLVLGLYFLRLLLLLPPLGERTGAGEPRDLLPGERGFPLREAHADEPRYRFDDRPFAAALDFLGAHLAEGETFYDFTNSPALYVIADRRFPTWVISSLIQTSETIQAQALAELDEWHRREQLPFVLFKQGTYWDALDGVHSEVRSYRIAEWVYRHYRPLVRLGGFEIWQDLRRDPIPIDWRTEIDFPVRERIVGTSIVVDRLSRRRGVAVRTGSDDPHLYGFLRMRGSPELATRDRWLLEIEGRSSVPGAFQIFHQLDGEEFDVARSHTVFASELEPGETEVWAMPIAERSGVITDLRVDPPEEAELEIARVTLTGLTDGRLGLAESGVEQSFDLRALPRVWARLDPLDALGSTRVLATLLDTPALVRPGGSVRLPLDPGLDRSRAGYLRVRVRSARLLGEPAREHVELYVRYDLDDCCGFVFDVGTPSAAAQPTGSVDHLVRLSTQWRWSHGEVESIRLWATRPLVIERVELREGD
ncbi:MAG TPA: hypothetical protein VMV46_09975 [Thermoanaerobaculia bacterium]|nr:hypothetical protein [Thermoanaerobaculia bacterium]